MAKKAGAEMLMRIEWEFNDNPTTTKLWIDGYQEIGFGARAWGQVSKAFDILVDDIAIDTKRIGPAK